VEPRTRLPFQQIGTSRSLGGSAGAALFDSLAWDRGHWFLFASLIPFSPPASSVVVQFGKEASQTRDCCVAKNATLRAARQIPRCAKNACSE
jgi:hypothetical protein